MPSHALTRPRVALAALAAAALLLTGCSSAASASPKQSAAKQTYSVDTLYGKVDVPAGAKRIVAVDFPEATALADLGVKPVGIGSYTPDLPAYTSFFKGVPIVTDDSGNPILEKIAAAKPDLIVMDMFTTDVEKNRATYDQLKAIAPTVVLKWTQAAGSWQEDAAGTAAAIGKTAQLDALKAAYEKHADEIRSKYADVLAGHTVDLISGTASDWYLYGPTSSHGRVLADAGARFGAAGAQKDGYVEYSPEKYGILGKTGLVMIAADATADAAPLTGNPVFKALPVAKHGDVVTTRYFFPSSYRIANALLDDFAGALDHVK